VCNDACACRFLTDKGIDHLRDYLGLPQDVVPATLKKSQRPLERAAPGARPPRREGFGGGGGFGGDREGYRREGGGFGRGAPADKAGAPGAYQPQFGGGFGRGAAPK